MADQYVECQHAIRYRAAGGTPAMAERLVSLGEDAEGNLFILHVCRDCWQQIVGMVLEDIAHAAIRDGVKGWLRHGR